MVWLLSGGLIGLMHPSGVDCKNDYYSSPKSPPPPSLGSLPFCHKCSLCHYLCRPHPNAKRLLVGSSVGLMRRSHAPEWRPVDYNMTAATTTISTSNVTTATTTISNTRISTSNVTEYGSSSGLYHDCFYMGSSYP